MVSRFEKSVSGFHHFITRKIIPDANVLVSHRSTVEYFYLEKVSFEMVSLLANTLYFKDQTNQLNLETQLI